MSSKQLTDKTVLLGHGSSGQMMKRIIDEVFLAPLSPTGAFWPAHFALAQANGPARLLVRDRF